MTQRLCIDLGQWARLLHKAEASSSSPYHTSPEVVTYVGDWSHLLHNAGQTRMATVRPNRKFGWLQKLAVQAHQSPAPRMAAFRPEANGENRPGAEARDGSSWISRQLACEPAQPPHVSR